MKKITYLGLFVFLIIGLYAGNSYAGGGGPICGNGDVEDGEECDDGNETSGDGCDASCMLEQECIAFADPSDIWPPNHKFVDINIVDGIGETFPIDSIISVEQDEPLNTFGDGNTCPDAVIENNGVSVRAERSGTKKVPGDGRIYIITFQGDDSVGNCTGSVEICVPHDQRKDNDCILSDTLYDSTESEYCSNGN